MVCNKSIMMTVSFYAVSVLVGNLAYAGELPDGGKVVDGNAHIYQQDSTLHIDQNTDKAIIDWNSFSVGKDSTVNFNQPDRESATLNRVTGNFTSEIAGRINANGSVFLVNPNGILITADGTIDTGNFVASTLDIDNSDFLNGDYTFTKSGENGVVSNRGTVSVDDGGFVALLGGAVNNDGFVRTHVGMVGFAGGEKIVMSFGNSDFLRVEVPTDKWQQLKDADGNKVSATLDLDGTIDSRGGFIDIAVADASDILRQTISIDGVISANTVSSQDGVISISGGTLGITSNGRITADADYGNAGRIDVAVQSLNMAAPMSATAATGNGGTIKVSLQQGASLSRGAVLDVSGKQGGSISFIGGLSGDKYYKVVGSGDFVADGSDGTGGYIDISNKNGLVGLFSGSISAKGTTMGGRIRIGGAFQGGRYNPKTSSLDTKTQDLFVHRRSDASGLTSAGKTSLGTGVHIDTSSASGAGGTVVLWADHTTNNYAQITATGATGGGAVEISGKKRVDSFGLKRVEVGDGVILLDPKNVVIGKFSDGLSQAKRIMATTPLVSFKLDLDDNDNFGSSVAISEDGTKLAVGARFDDTGATDNGAVYLFKIDGKGSQWGSTLIQDYKVAYGSGLNVKQSNAQFGKSVAFNADGTKLVVGMPYVKKASQYRSGKGRIFMFSVHWGNGVYKTAELEYGGNGYFGTGVALSDDGTKLAVGETHDSGGSKGDANYMYNAGSVSLFVLYRGGNNWGTARWRTGRIFHNVGGLTLSAYDAFGYSVALSGDGSRLAVGAEGTDSNRGAVHFFTVGGSSWGKAVSHISKISNGSVTEDGTRLSFNREDFFGGSVALSDDGTKLAVGAIYDDTAGQDLGAVYLFTVGGTTWGGKVTLARTITDGVGVALSSIDKFGYSVAFNTDGSRLVVGAVDDDSHGNNAGTIYLFAVDSTTWGSKVTQALKLSHGASLLATISLDDDDWFGSSVSLSSDGTKLAVGAYGDDDRGWDRGAVYLYTIVTYGVAGATWGSTVTQMVKLSSSRASVSLSADGTKLAVGAPHDGGRRGAVYLYTVGGSGATWGNTVTQAAKLFHGASLSSGTVSLGQFSYFGSGVSLSGDGTKLAVGAYGDGVGGAKRGGAVYLYTVGGSGATWGSTVTQAVKLSHGATLSSGTVSLDDNDNFGSSVSLSTDGMKLAVGATGDDDGGSNRGAVYLYTVGGSGATWGSTVTQAVKLSDSHASVSLDDWDYFGTSVSLSADGTKLVVGASRDDDGGSNRGAVYLYTVGGSGATWGSTVTQAVKLSDSHASVSLDDDDRFGRSVSLSGDGTKLAVGASRDDDGGSNRGAVYLYTIGTSGATWGGIVTQAVKLSHGTSLSSATVSLDNNDWFGIDVSLSTDGTKLAIGAWGDDDGGSTQNANRGAVYLYTVGGSGATWGSTITQAIKLSHGVSISSHSGRSLSLDDWDIFGTSVSLSGDGTKLVVGAYGDDDGGSGRGAVYLYTVGGATWGSKVTQAVKLSDSHASVSLDDNDKFGYSVLLSADGTKLAVGATGDDDEGWDQGAVYLYTVGGSTWGSTVTQAVKLSGSHASVSLDDNDKFGYSVSLSADGTKLAVGATGDDDGGYNRGAVYLYTVGGSTWGSTVTQAVKLSDSHASVSLDFFDDFGSSVSLSADGTKLAVGATGDDDGGFGRGAVYLYTVGGATWGSAVTQAVKLSDSHASVSLENFDLFGSGVSLSADGTKLAVGATGDDDGGFGRGAVYLYTVGGATWGSTVTQAVRLSHGAILSAISLDDDDRFGSSVSLSSDGTKLAVGAMYDDDGSSSQNANRGAVYLYTIGAAGARWGSTVTQMVKLSDSHAGVSLSNWDYFGSSVSLSSDGTKLAVGATGDDDGGTDRGAVYLYMVGGSTWGSTVMRAVKLSHGAISATISLDDDDRFGSGVSLSSDGTKLAVGAMYDDDGSSSQNANRGAVYLYTVGGSGATWGSTVTQAVKLSHGAMSATISLDDDDRFGSGVSLSSDGTKLAVGAMYDDDGSSSQNANRGAVYLYTIGTSSAAGARWGSTVTQMVKLSDSHASVSLSNWDYFGSSVSLSSDGTKLAVGATGDDDGGTDRGAVYLYMVGGSTWGSTVMRAVKLSHGVSLSSGTISLDNGDKFGSGVSLSGDGTKLAVGAPDDDDGGSGCGAVYLYIVGGTTVTQANMKFVVQNVTLSLTKNETFGSAVALSDDGTKLAVGAQFNDTGGTDRGAVHLFELSGGDSFGDNVYYTAKIADGNGVSLSDKDKFGAAVALSNDGSTLVVGAPNDDTNGNNFGAVYLLSVGGIFWGDTVAQLGKLVSNTAGNFGDAVAVSGDGTKLAVGIPKQKDSGGNRRGAVQLYTIENSGNTYSFKPQATYMHGSVLESTTLFLKRNEQFGYSVALSDDGATLAVGAIGYDGYRGRAYLFALKEKAGIWGATPKKVGEIGNGDAGISLSRADYFGGAVALSRDGSKLAVGAHGDNTGGRSYGAVYVFSVRNNTISKNYKIAHGSDISLAPSGQFGWALALTGDGKNLVVGAPRTDGTLVDEGAIYLLNLSKDTVSPIIEKLKTGTNINIVASNDITVDDDLITTAGVGKLILIAGRSIKINSDVKIHGGLVLTANDASDSSFVVSDRDTARAEITVASGKTISGGDGDLLIKMRTGNSDAPMSTKQTGNITVWKADGARVSIVHLGVVDAHNDAEIVIRNGGQITATGDHDKGDVVIELAAERFTNNSGGNALKIAGSTGDKGRFLIWTISSAATHLNGIAYDFGKSNVTYNAARGDFQANPVAAADSDNAKYKSGVLYRIPSGRNSRFSYEVSNSKTTSTVTLGGSGSGTSSGTFLLGASAILSGGSVIPPTSVANTENIFTTGIYAHLNGIDMQALYQPQKPQESQKYLASIFNTPHKITYKAKYTTTYDMTMLAHNIKAQKAVPLYELDEKLYKTLKHIFVQQSAPTNKIDSIDTENNAPV